MASSVFIQPGIGLTSFAGTYLAGDGTAAATTYGFASDPDNGMYYSNSATAKTRFSFDGTFVLGINATGVTFGGDTDLTRTGAGSLALNVGTATPAGGSATCRLVFG